MNKRTFIAFAMLFTGASVFLFNSFYQEAKNTAIVQLNDEQRIHAKQAARGIEDFFAAWTRSLYSLSKMDAIIDNNAVGKRYLKFFYEANQEQIKSITRMDERGVIIYNFPQSSSLGSDISNQEHVRELLRDHKPVISDVFRAVEGFDTVAIVVPIFKGTVFKGSITVLVNFESLAKRYLDVIKIGETGYAWVVSRDGTVLYSPIPEFIGKSVSEITKDFPSLNVMVNDMIKGREAAATYTFDRIGERNVGQTSKYAVYMPVRIGNTFWSIVVASAEQDVLSGLISFRNKLAVVIVALVICGIAFSTLGAKAWFIVKEEENRKEIEKQLRESEARLRDIIFSMADWVWEVDEKRVYTYSSTKGDELFGHVIGKTPFDLMPPDEANRVAAIFSEIASKKASIKDLENWNIGKNGKRICLLTNGVPILDEAGNLKGYRGVDKDITERKSMEESLQTSEEKFREFFKNTPDYCYIISPEGTILNINRSALRALGYEREDLIGKPLSMIYETGSYTRMKELFDQWKANGQIRNEEMIIITKKGEKHTVLLNVGAVRNKDGTIKYSTSVQTDITEHKLAEAARREGLERYKAVVEAFDGFIYICSADHRVEFMNKRLIERTGRNAVGELCYKALHDKESICEWCVNERVFKDETVRWEVQSPKDHRWYYSVNTPIHHADGTISKQAMIMDITERKQAEETLKENESALRLTQKDLQKLAGRLISAQEEELRRLSRELHDDLTQRLAVLAIESGMLEIELNKKPEATKDTIQKISQIKDQLIKVSEDVHSISRQIHPTILDDLGLVRAIESQCAAFMRRHPVGITFKKEHVPDEIQDDIALCLYRVVQEGLRNIAAHSQSKVCEILLSGADHTLCLTVTDDGVGFDPLEVRLMPGLGLSSMRERVQLVQGDFSIRSRPGQGTVISVSVPLAGGDA